MRKKIMSICFIIFFILIILWAVYEIKDKDKESDETNYKVEADISPAVCTVNRGTLDSVYSTNGLVSSDENDILKIYNIVYEKNDRVKLSVNPGDKIEKGKLIYSINDEKVLSDCEGQVVDITDDNNEVVIKILDYSKLYVDIKVPYEVFEELDYSSEVFIGSDSDEYEAVIEKIGYVYYDNGIDVRISLPEYVMPNKEVSVRINLSKTKEMVYVPSEFITVVADVSYAYVIPAEDEFATTEEENDSDTPQNLTIQTEVKLGREYMVYEEGNIFKYYEVISGINEGQMLSSEPLTSEVE